MPDEIKPFAPRNEIKPGYLNPLPAPPLNVVEVASVSVERIVGFRYRARSCKKLIQPLQSVANSILEIGSRVAVRASVLTEEPPPPVALTHC
jgi:hypothetical protein